MIRNKKVLITGFAGSIGSELTRQLCEQNEIYGIDISESGFGIIEELRQKGFNVKGIVGDVRDKSVFNGIGIPDIIFHCAALKHVTPSGWNPEEYVRTNILGTLNVLDFANKNRVKLVNISTDKVVNTNSIMGATKKVAEIAVRDAGHISVRFGNVLGSRGSLIEIWQRQIEKGESLTVTDERMTRYMMTIEEAVKLVIEASEIGEPGSIVVMDMGKKENILDLAKEILKKSDNKVGIKMIGTRPGEMLTEILMTEEEEKSSVKKGKFSIII